MLCLLLALQKYQDLHQQDSGSSDSIFNHSFRRRGRWSQIQIDSQETMVRCKILIERFSSPKVIHLVIIWQKFIADIKIKKDLALNKKGRIMNYYKNYEVKIEYWG